MHVKWFGKTAQKCETLTFQNKSRQNPPDLAETCSEGRKTARVYKSISCKHLHGIFPAPPVDTASEKSHCCQKWQASASALHCHIWALWCKWHPVKAANLQRPLWTFLKMDVTWQLKNVQAYFTSNFKRRKEWEHLICRGSYFLIDVTPLFLQWPVCHK